MNIRETTDLLKVTIAFELKDIFKSTFKTAKWDSYSKTWDVKNTTANKNKLAQFEKTLAETNVEEKIKAAEEALLTENQVTELKAQFERVGARIRDLEDIKASQLELQATIQKLTSKIEEKKDIVAQEQAQIAAVKAENERQLNAVLGNYKYQGMNVQETVEYAGKQFAYYLRYKGNYLDNFYAAQKFLGETYDDIAEKFGIEFTVLDQCWNANKNRHDRDGHWFSENVCDPRYVKAVDKAE